jgi:hypothetical protein
MSIKEENHKPMTIKVVNPDKIKLSSTNIILTNLSAKKLEMVLELCVNEGIHYTFDKDYYSNDNYDFYKVLEDLILNNNNKIIPGVYQELIENQYKDFIEDSDDFEKRDIILEKINNLKYKKF